MTVEERLAKLELEVALLKSNRPVAPSVRLLAAAEITARTLRAWREAKGELIGDPDYDDYTEVVSTLPILEEAIAAVKEGMEP
jgi:hypothetical protein